MKKALTESQTLRAGCNKAEPNISAPPQTPFPVPERGTLVTSWRWSLPLPTNPVWWGSMHAISNYCGNRPTHAHTPIHKQTGPITIHCAAASAQCNNRSQLVLEYSTRCLTGSQWRSRNREVTWSRRDEPATRRTACWGWTADSYWEGVHHYLVISLDLTQLSPHSKPCVCIRTLTERNESVVVVIYRPGNKQNIALML